MDAIAEAEVVIAGYECFDEELLAAAPQLRAILVIELEFDLAVLHWRWKRWKPPQSHSLNGRPRDGGWKAGGQLGGSLPTSFLSAPQRSQDNTW
ncbi:hypothetical protein [Mesorhizobium sp. M0870]|uniref:hypothetical protein n=1 Tax=Mesorhizobium sp. M0870 TaxID=2957016 RepID=UPI0033381E00